MRPDQDLQLALRERYRRCLVQGCETLAHETSLTRDWIRSQPALMSILTAAGRFEPSLDVHGWLASFGQLNRGLSWPSRSEAGRATLAWAAFNAVADDPGGDVQTMIRYAHWLGEGGNLNDDARLLVERIYQPLFDYLTDHIAQGGSVLYLLERFARSVEWFDRDQLYAAYAADTSKGEGVYDRALRQFLFREGVDMPFSQAKSPSGVSDVLGDLTSDEPLVCEVKLFLSDKRPVATGVHQAVMYAQDHGQSTAYLIIINLSGRPLNLPTDGPTGQTPSYLDISGVRVYLVALRALPPARSASKAGKASPITITRAQLLE